MRRLDGSGFSVSVAGNGKRKRSPDYPCVSRFRQRRLLSFLRRQKLFDTYDALTAESGARIDLDHLTDLVKEGRWDEAIEHLSRFLPPDPALGVYGRVLLHFLPVHKAVHDIVSGAPESRAVSAALRMCFTKNFAITKLRAILWSLLSSSGFGDSLDFGRVRDKAASTVVYLAYQTPELKEHVKEARGPAEPHNVLPIGFGFRPRRHVKRGPIQGSVLFKHYLHMRRMLASSISSHCEGLSSESLIKAKEWMVDLVDSSLEAGNRHQGYPLQYVCTPMVHKGAPVDPVLRNNLGTFRSPARNPGMSSDTDFDMLVLKTKEWTVYLIDQRLEAWPDLSQGYEAFRCVNKDGVPVARVSQTIPYTLMGPAKSFTISSVTNAEVPFFFQLPHPLKGGLSSQAMSAILAPPYDQFLISTEKNAGALSSEAMSAILASPSKYIKANAGSSPARRSFMRSSLTRRRPSPPCPPAASTPAAGHLLPARWPSDSLPGCFSSAAPRAPCCIFSAPVRARARGPVAAASCRPAAAAPSSARPSSPRIRSPPSRIRPPRPAHCQARLGRRPPQRVPRKRYYR